MTGHYRKRVKYTWDAKMVRALRQHMGVSQQEMAEEMGTRQQTISEWETALYQPRGTSRRMLNIIAERSAFYDATRGQGTIPQKNADTGK